MCTAQPELPLCLDGPTGLIDEIKTMGQSDILINGGYFVFKHSIFDHIEMAKSWCRNLSAG